MADFARKAMKMLLRGLVLARPIDLLSNGELNISRNVRSYISGTIQQRPGQTVINTTPLTPVGNAAIHSVRRLNDDLSGATNPYLRIVGAGTGLYAGTTFTGAELTAIASGFDGAPLTLIPYRPTQSPEPFMYVGNANKLGKVKDDRTFRNMGIAPPTTPPSYIFTAPTRVTIDTFQSAASWNATGLATGGGATKLATTVTYANIAAILYDSGTTGYCSIAVTASYMAITEGNTVGINLPGVTPETTIIERVIPGISNTTVASIMYDGGTTGPCTVVLNKNSRRRVTTDGMLTIGGEAVRITSTSIGADDQQSFRCTTTGTRSAGDAVVGLDSFRCVTTLNHVAAEPLAAPVLQTSLNTGTVTGIATWTKTGLTLDLSNISGRPVQDTDEMYFSVRVSSTALASVVPELQIMLDCGDSSFTQNFFIQSIKPSDFQPTMVQGSTTTVARQAAIQNQQIADAAVTPTETPEQIRQRLLQKLEKARQNNNVERVRRLTKRLARLTAEDTTVPIDTKTGTGQSALIGQSGTDQYWIMRFRVKDLTRVGSDATVGLKTINALRINAFIQDQTVATSPVFQFQAWWIGGAFGPDVGELGTPYTWRYRYRASESGAASRPSPMLRASVSARRQRVQLTPTASADAQVDKIDWFRLGGSLTTWRYVGTGPNTTAAFNDDYPDDSLGNEGLEFDRYQPFPVVDLPRTGTCNVSGTSVTRTAGDTFNTSWAPGSRIIVNGVPASIYRVISTSLLETVENIGALSAVSFFLPDPLIQGQALPAMWGPFIDSDGAIRFLACGATSQEGRLFVTTGNDPDSAPAGVAGDEITSPSEPLMNGCVFDGRAWVFSNLRLFDVAVDSILDSDQVQITAIRFQEVPNSRGLFARYGLCVTPQGIVFIASDGIYITNGGFPESLTDDLYPIFPHDGQAGVATSGVNPPDFSLPNQMGLDYGDGFIKFWYTDTGGARRTFVRDMTAGGRASLDTRLTVVGGWVSLDTYAAPISCHYYEEGRGLHSELGGGTDGRLYQLTGTTDAGAAITSQIRLGAFDAGDSRAQKLFGDAMLDYTSAGNITATIGFDNYATLLTPRVLGAKAARIPQAIMDINAGVGQEAVNVTVDLAWTDPTAVLYEWQPSYLTRPENVLRRVTDDDNLGFAGPKYIRGITIEADTLNVVKDVLIQGDTGTNGVMTTQAGTLSSIRHDGRARIDYAFTTPFIAHLVRMLPNDTDPFKLYDWAWVFDQYPPLDALITSWTDAGVEGAKFLQGIVLKADTGGASISVDIQGDEGVVGATISANHGGQSEKPYTFTPFIGHEFRLVPAGNIRIFNVRWVFEPEPELVTRYITQIMGNEQKSFQHFRDMEIAFAATADVTLTLTLDGVAYSYTLTHNGGVFIKRYLPVSPVKFKTVSYSFTSNAGFRLYKNDCWVRGKPWAGQQYQRFNPFGAVHATDGAAI